MEKTFCDLCGKVVKPISVNHPKEDGVLIEIPTMVDRVRKSTDDMDGHDDICRSCLKKLL